MWRPSSRFAFALILAAVSASCASAPETPGPDTSAPADASTEREASAAAPFSLSSSAFVDGATLPVAYTCDGAGVSPPLAWTSPPEGTRELAVLMTTLALDGLKWNWVLYGIPASVSALAEATSGVGTAGRTSDGPSLAYAPPCSQGPGAKSYVFTVYALSGSPPLGVAPDQVTGAVLSDALGPLTLAKSELTVDYTRR